MRGLEEIYLKGFSYDKYLGIASKEAIKGILKNMRIGE